MHLEPQRQVEREGQQWSINSASGWGEVDMWHFFWLQAVHNASHIVLVRELS